MPLAWVIDRLLVRMDSESGIVNDACSRFWCRMLLDTLMAATCLLQEAVAQARPDQDQSAHPRCP
jgi:predicted helicase